MQSSKVACGLLYFRKITVSSVAHHFTLYLTNLAALLSHLVIIQ